MNSEKITWLRVYPTRANFVLCRVLQGDARSLRQRLQDKGILVRYFDQPPLQDCIRISVGKPEHTHSLVKVLKEIGDSL